MDTSISHCLQLSLLCIGSTPEVRMCSYYVFSIFKAEWKVCKAYLFLYREGFMVIFV